MQLLPSEDRGRAKFGWLDSRHSFSFGSYHNPEYMGFGALRVINEDRVKPGAGFETHAHQDMEIISYILEGGLEHKDSIGTGSVIKPGDVQRMTAGTGIRHSEFNASKTDPVHFLQIWVVPDTKGLTPGYEQKSFPLVRRENTLLLIGSRDGRDGSITIHQDVDLYTSLLMKGQAVSFTIKPKRMLWIQIVSGYLDIGGNFYGEGDGLGIHEEEGPLTLKSIHDKSSEFLLFDLSSEFATS
ncbi:pirin family protein [Sneathiella sp. HT1-7]|uniref:pirin family protein n=1 Tax=Sneathiella sp. HT1-7 TaxID=2887192 RepID=UPI001D14524E|nr:pirin family protein [Sneathiella sp. HT1-7]MCC3306212.1 pirin family protein [Sneathiella sp. HT1-7]